MRGLQFQDTPTSLTPHAPVASGRDAYMLNATPGVFPWRIIVNELRALIIELDDAVADLSRSSTWSTVRCFFITTVRSIDAARPVRRVADAMRDLEASFLITAQREAWLDGERREWLESVRTLSRVDSALNEAFGIMRVIGGLLNDLAMSLRDEAFRREWIERDPEGHGVTKKTAWHTKLDVILTRGSGYYDALAMRDDDVHSGIGPGRGVALLGGTRNDADAAYDISTDALWHRQNLRRQRVSRSRYLQFGVITGRTVLDDDPDDPFNACALEGVEQQSELLRLRDEVERMKLEREQEVLCTICYTNKRDTVVCPCLHLMYCHACVSRLRDSAGEGRCAKCPHCRAPMSGLMRIFS